MNYNLVISKENKAVKSITFYLPDVEHIWLGYGDDGLVVEDSYAEFTITYKDLSEVEDFELPYIAQEEEKAFDEAVSEMKEWQSAYIAALEDGTIVVSEFCTYALRDLDVDGVPELFRYDDSIRSTYLYAFVDGGVKEVLCRWGEFLVNNNLLHSDDKYENAIIYEYASGRVEEVFNAQHDANDCDIYYYEGNMLNGNDMLKKAEEYFGTAITFDNTQYLEFEYNKDSINQAIVEGNFSSGDTYSSIQEVNENLSTFTFTECGGYITSLEMTNNILSVTTEEGENINYSIDENCEWLEMGSDGSVYGNHTFNASREAYQKEQDEQKVKDLSQIIIDPQEQKIAVMGSSYLESMLHGGGLSKGFGILTDKRFYFKGKCFIKALGRRVFVDEEYTVDLENITASGFVYIKRIWMIILSFISLIVGFVGLATEGEEELMLICIGAFLVLLIVYFLTKRVYYEVHFEGGMISVNVSKYGGIKEVRAFNKKLRLAKDKYK